MMKRFLTLISFVFAVGFFAAGVLLSAEAENKADNRALSVAERVAYQRKIEEVYWQRRLWNNSQPKPKLEEVLPSAIIRAKVEDGLRKSNALEKIFNHQISPEQLRGEVERMAQQTKNAEMLGELFAALDNDSFLIAEILARPALTEAFLKDAFFADARFQTEGKQDANVESENLRDEAAFENWWREHKNEFGTEISYSAQSFELPIIAPVADDTWSTMTTTPVGGTDVSAVWTGTEMIVWNGGTASGVRYNPATDMTIPVLRTNAPVSRVRHMAVWTGTEMIIWGGSSSAAPIEEFRIGGRYNPLTETWTRTSAVNAPSVRTEHTAVWTGSEMIIWSGSDAITGNYLQSGGRYNPANDTWTPTSQTNTPSGRNRHTAVWTGTEMIVWGGVSGNGGVNTGGRYNPSTDSWTATSTVGAPSGRFNHSAVWTGTEMIIWGGNFDFTIFNTGGRYNPAADSWTPTAIPALQARRLHTAVWTGSEMIVFGGCVDIQCSDSRQDGSRYNPANDTWTPTALLTGNNRSRHAAVWTGTEMLVAGGCRSGECQVRVTNIIRYNPSTNMWREARFEPLVVTPRQPHRAVWTGTEMLIWGVDAQILDTSVYRFNPATNRWTRTFVLGAPDARFNFSLVWTGTEMIVWGGDVQGLGITRTGARFNPMTDTWTETEINGSPSARNLHEAVWTGAEMIIWGGSQGSGTFNTGGRYNPATNTWTTTSTTNAPTSRVFHTVVWTGTEMIVWGGSNLTMSSIFNTGGRYNPATNTWTATSTAGAPSARNSHTAVWTGAEMIIWGGRANATLFNTGGRYNPANNTWAATSLTNAPSPRWIHSAVWTGTEMIVWGGIVNNAFPFESTNTGGRYNPSADNWRPTTLLAAPDKRNAHTAVWTGSQMIIWGGSRDPESGYVNTGSIYNVETGPPPTPTPTPTSTPTPTPTQTPTPAPTPTPTPTPSNGAGNLDLSFGTQGKQVILIPNINEPGGLVWNPPEDIVFQPDGKILIGGSAYNTFTGFDFTVTRFNADGSLDSSFANNGVFRYDFAGNNDDGFGIALQPDGKIILAGEAYLGVFNSQVDTAFGIIRLNPNGSLDSTFGTGGVVTTNFFGSLDSATEVALQPDGKIIATGYVTQGGVNNGSTYDFALVRYNPNGSLDTTFGSGGKVTTDFNNLGDRAQSSVLQPDGKIVLTGWVYTTIAGQLDFGLARYNTDGSLDTTFDGDGKAVTTFGTNLSELARAITIAPDGKLVVAGDFYNPPPIVGQSGHNDVALARYNTDGSLDTSFDGDGKFIYNSNLTDSNEGADDVVVQSDGKILFVGGSHLIVNAVPGVSDKDMMIIRLNVNGSFDNSFGTNGIVLTDFGIFNQPGPPEFGSGRTGDTISTSTIGLQPDGKIVAACDATFRRAHHRLAIARYLNDTTPPTPTTVSGRVTYINAPTTTAVPNTTLTAAGSIPLSTTTNSSGDYSLSGFGSGAYTITPTKANQVNGISNLDAATVAQHVAGLIELNDPQLVAADTSGNGTISSLDAALIAQFAAGIPNPGITGTWKFILPSRLYPNVMTNQTNQNYSAILVGDVTGNWNPAGALHSELAAVDGEQTRQAEKPEQQVAVTARTNQVGEEKTALTIDLTAVETTGAGILGYQFELLYDKQVVEPQAISCDVSETISREMTAICRVSESGVMKVVVFGATPISGTGTLLKLKFNVIRATGSTLPLRIENFMFNEDMPTAVTVSERW